MNCFLIFQCKLLFNFLTWDNYIDYIHVYCFFFSTWNNYNIYIHMYYFYPWTLATGDRERRRDKKDHTQSTRSDICSPDCSYSQQLCSRSRSPKQSNRSPHHHNQRTPSPNRRENDIDMKVMTIERGKNKERWFQILLMK